MGPVGTHPVKDTVGKTYDVTSAGSPARRLVVDMHITHGRVKWVADDNPDDNHPTLLEDLSRALLEKVSAPVASRSFDFRTRILVAEDYFA